MESYIGRQAERAEFRRLLSRAKASLVTCQGRRRIGKSRFIHECAAEADHFIKFMGLPPRDGMSKQVQLDEFVSQLSEQSKAPKITLESWPTAFQLLASQLPTTGSVVLLLDEISWMAIGDPDFAGHLKRAWDDLFSKHSQLVLVLCGSVSSWIEENILRSTGFVGRCSWNFRLGPLSLAECVQFWGNRGSRVSVAEKIRFLAVIGGVPRYLEELDPAKPAEETISALCFNPHGLLFQEFDAIFHDIFSRKAATYREIVRTLVAGPRSVEQISEELGRQRGGSLSAALLDLEQAGFISRSEPFDPTTGKSRPREARYRLSDNYLRFYLKYIEPKRDSIHKGRLKRLSPDDLEGWDTVLGLQFENLILANLPAVYAAMGLDAAKVLAAAPYAQRKTLRREGCQIDLLIRTRRVLYVCEIKLQAHLQPTLGQEVQEKIRRLKLPKGLSTRTGLIYCGELPEAVRKADDFDYLVPVEQLMANVQLPPPAEAAPQRATVGTNGQKGTQRTLRARQAKPEPPRRRQAASRTKRAATRR